MIGFRIRAVDVTASTNDDAMKAAEAGEPEGLVIRALKQTSGRGRHGRQWESPEGNLYCSALLRPGDTRSFGHYSFVAALALGETVKEFLPHATVTLKWPNDVLVDGKKIGGILLEAGQGWLVIGMGLNIQHHPDDAMVPATSLCTERKRSKSDKVLPPLRGELEGGYSPQEQNSAFAEATPHLTSPSRREECHRDAFDIDHVLQKLLERLSHWHEIMKTEGFEPIRAAWLENAQKGRLTARLAHETLEGNFETIDAEGRLRLRLADGAERVIATGDVFFASGD